MHGRWGQLGLVVLAVLWMLASGSLAETWIQYYEHEHEVHVGTVLVMGDEYWLVGTNVATLEPPEAGIVVFRIQPDGNLICPMSYDWDGVQSAADALILPDGEILFAGQTDQYGAVGADIYVLHTDGSGQTLSEWVFGASLQESATRILLGSQGDLFVIGTQVNPDDVIADPETPGYGGLEGRAAPYVVRVQPGGSPVWKESYRSEDNIVVFDAAATSTGGCYLLSTVYAFPDAEDAIRLDKLDDQGRIMWSRTFDQGDCKGYALLQLPSRQLLIAGSQTADATNPSALLMLLDATGREVWSRTYGGADKITVLHELVQTEDGHIVAVGTQFEDYAQYQDDIYLLCVDADGEVQWEQTHSTGRHVMIEAVRGLEGGGLLIAGTGAIAGDRFQGWLMHLDSQDTIEAP